MQIYTYENKKTTIRERQLLRKVHIESYILHRNVEYHKHYGIFIHVLY